MTDRRPGQRRFLGSVRVRITVAATFVFAVALVLASVLLVHSVRGSIKERIRDDGDAALADLKTRLARGERPENLHLPPSGRVPWVQVVDVGGRVLVHSPSLADRPPFVETRDGRIVPAPPEAGEPDRLIVYQRVTSAVGPVTVVAASPLDEVSRSVDALAEVLTFGIPALVVLVGLAAWVLAGRALRPVDEIRAEVAAISATSMHRRVPEPTTDDEVAHLARTMNDMLDRLESASERQRRFVSDASHELRSPVASIRATVEVALHHQDQADWPVVAGQVLAEDERMEQIVAELLDLARLEEDGEPLPDTTVDVDELVMEEVARLRGADVRTERVSAGRVHGSRGQLARVVRNLLDNAVRHAASTVALSLQQRGATVELAVEDDGPGVAPADRERIFERFTRLEEARSRDGGGVGLGLAMARAIVERHGGTVSVGEGELLHGARFVVALPAAEPAPPDA
jgi:signal transduction histidine kinase